MQRILKAVHAMPGPTILIIDDDPLVRELLGNFLKTKTGCRVLTAANGQEGLDHLRTPETRAGLVITDLNMPDTDGVELMQGLAALGYQGPIIVVSGAAKSTFNAASTLGRASGLNIIGSIRKPIDYGALLALAQQALMSRAA